MERFADRAQAGRELARHLGEYAGRYDVLVLGLPRGGVPVAAQVAEALGAPLDVFVVRKLGVPGHEELAMGAIASGGTRVLDQSLIDDLGISKQAVELVAQREGKELERRDSAYRHGRPPLDVRGKTVIIVDDGLATGSTMRAAVEALKATDAERIVVAVPVASDQGCDLVAEVADAVVCLAIPSPFLAVGFWYADFGQVTDAEVSETLERRRAAAELRP